jgi:Putative secretion activating protein
MQTFLTRLIEFIKSLFSKPVNTQTQGNVDNSDLNALLQEAVTAGQQGEQAVVDLVNAGIITEPDNTENQEVVKMTDTTYFTKAGIINGIIDAEGGYVNRKDDAGGETNFGITYAVANTRAIKKILVDDFSWDGTMLNLTRSMAYRIYEINYWNKMNLDTVFLISPSLADKLFDQSVNLGVSRTVKWLQRALNAFNRKQKDYNDIGVDGGLGNETIKSLNAFVHVRGRDNAVRNLLRALVCAQGYHYLTISEDNEDNESSTYGWYDHRLPLNLKKYPELNT